MLAMASLSISFGENRERRETPPAPLSTVPFRRDPDFGSRDTLLDDIHRKISAPRSRIALVDIGGIGECKEYRILLLSPTPIIGDIVFWVHASNAVRFEQSFRDIADQVKMFGLQDPKVNIFQLVQSWLHDGKRGKWLLILDNIDDNGFLHQPLVTGQQGLKVGQTNASTKPLLGFLPQSPNRSIITTCWSQEVALRIVDHQDIIKVEPMKKPEAVELVQRKVGLPAETPDILNDYESGHLY
ncbi:hypothetical protein N7509_004383 [Penicillium cosmopolitanum]|uniref:Uncharacterized protein n=1 Tax=Penicillium cosmopolitanum TaxID=1131564 RepID=A0A9W9W6W5_9EURO|nr:uncharacterized protein N7509_004383 [Penicillium cosmopolitanum]KAJ5404512.1 hypothetical protein N7509_004383 [Penicillium cosmopolitanum]